jgi:hypothetical protein
MMVFGPFIIVRWTDKAGEHSGDFSNYKTAANAAKKLSKETGGSVVVRHVPSGSTWIRYVDGKKVHW